ncbi:MAG TPA: FKBP-type peptidyl-prolyl cis-trans isomerase [Pirellulales bacterium]|nr:FKBP-type peptidyl-prolyl cis-trans isomerase [Pirellulales bacterium]
MRLFLFSCFMLAMAGAFAFAADPPQKKNVTAPAAAKPARDAADAQPADNDDADADQDEKPAPKKKGTGLKLTTADEARLLKALSYMQGYELGKQVAQFSDIGIDLDEEIVLAAFKDAMEGKEPTMSEKDRTDAMPEIQKLVQEKRTAKLRELGAKNKEEGKAFLAQNKKKEGVKTLPSGLQYKVLKSGKGETPKKTDTVKAHYKGTLLNGNEFDSSYRRGQPASFPVNRVIPGWTEALQLMKVGDKWQLFIPSGLAYGEQGAGNGGIPPNATLVFEVELLGVEKGNPSLPTLK